MTADGVRASLDSPDDIASVVTSDGTRLEEGEDYVFEDGALVFVTDPSGEPLKVTLTTQAGLVFSDMVVDATVPDSQADFLPTETGEFVQIAPGKDLEEAFEELKAGNEAHRVKVIFNQPFKGGAVLALAARPDGAQVGVLLPEFAWRGFDGGVAFDVQALGPKDGPEDLEKRVWILFLADGAGVTAIRFSILTALERADLPTPGQPGDPSPLPPAQTVFSNDVAVLSTVAYSTLDKAVAGENVRAAGPQPGQ